MYRQVTSTVHLHQPIWRGTVKAAQAGTCLPLAPLFPIPLEIIQSEHSNCKCMFHTVVISSDGNGSTGFVTKGSASAQGDQQTGIWHGTPKCSPLAAPHWTRLHSATICLGIVQHNIVDLGWVLHYWDLIHVTKLHCIQETFANEHSHCCIHFVPMGIWPGS